MNIYSHRYMTGSTLVLGYVQSQTTWEKIGELNKNYDRNVGMGEPHSEKTRMERD
jgi:hypothetical protein